MLQLHQVATAVRFPAFVKPKVSKQFEARVYASLGDLAEQCEGLSGTEWVLVSKVVSFTAEARTFILNRRVLDCAIYEGHGDAAAAASFADEVARYSCLPKTCVLDVGLVGNDWVLSEANATWGAGLNGCDAEKVVKALVAATGVAGVGSRP